MVRAEAEAEVQCLEPVGLVNMMKVAKQVENRELIWSKTLTKCSEKST